MSSRLTTNNIALDSAKMLADKYQALNQSSNWRRYQSHQLHSPIQYQLKEHKATQTKHRVLPVDATKKKCSKIYLFLQLYLDQYKLFSICTHFDKVPY